MLVRSCLAAVMLFAVPAAMAGSLGDPAAPLAVKEWLKGEPVDLAKAKAQRVHVIEFWATWCGPCRLSAPHLTELQKKHGDKVTIVGVTNEKPDVVQRYLDKQGDKIGYAIAVDEDRRKESYMGAFNRNGIPHAFIVDRAGNIVWEGHPMTGLDEALQRVLDGQLGSAPVNLREKFFALGPDTPAGEVRRAGQAIIEASGNDVDALIEFGREILAQPEPRDRYLPTLYATAQAAVKLSKGKDPNAHELLAESFYLTGNTERAERYIKLALRAPKQSDEDRARRKQALERYAAAAGVSAAPGSK
jgi:thiol-disulfide isomerase/thioredoxin